MATDAKSSRPMERLDALRTPPTYAHSKRGVRRAKDKPTIQMVAERAGVAVSTVSRALNGGYASAATQACVQLAVRELGYTPSAAARSLVTGRSGSIGVVVASSQSSWFTQILSGIEEELADSRHTVLLASLRLKGRYDASAVSAWIRHHRVDGLIFIRYTRRERRLFKTACDVGLPIVLIAPDVADPMGFVVRCNNVEAGRLAGQHLARLGHCRVAFAGGPRESLDSRDRLRGLRTELLTHGTAVAPHDVWFAPTYAATAGMEYGQRFVSRAPANRPTAVVLGNDAMALGFMRTVLQRGVQIPGQVSVVGFDCIPSGALYWPGLTTVLQPAYLMGAAGCHALLERIVDPKPRRVTSVEYGVELVVRESTAKAPVPH